MKRKIFSILFTLVLVLSMSLIPAMPAMADTPAELSTKLANILKGSQVDCNNDGTKDLWKDTWGDGSGNDWDDYTMVLWSTAVAALTKHGDATEADNALTYVLTTNLNWAQKATEELIVGDGGSAWHGDGSASDPGKTEGKMNSAWYYTTTQWGGGVRRHAAENMENLIIGVKLLAAVGKYDEAATIADAIIGQTSPNKPWTGNRQYWTGDHTEFVDWGMDDSILMTVGFRNALELITLYSAHDYSTEITAINNWKGGQRLPVDDGTTFSTWNEAIDYWFGDENGAGAAEEDWSGYFRYVWFVKLSANDDAASAQAVADNVDYSTMSYAGANLWAIIMMNGNEQSTEASKMTAALFNKYWDYNNDSIKTASKEDWAAATLLMASEVAPITADKVWVDDDYSGVLDNDNHTWGYDAFDNIQDGINAVSSGGTVTVAAGTYSEQVSINKSLTLQEASSATIIDGGGTGTAVTINASSVTITGFTIQNAANGISVTLGTGNKIHHCNIISNNTYGLNNTSGNSVDATNNWWGDASGPKQATTNPSGLGDEVSDNVNYDPWIGKTGTPSDHEVIGTGATATLDLTGAGGGSSVDVDMDDNESAEFSAVEETGEPTQGFAGMGSGGGINKSIVVTTDADDGEFIAVVKLHYTDGEFANSGILSESAIRLYYWNTADEEWELAVAGNIGGTAQNMGNTLPPDPLVANDLGRYGVHEPSNIAWAIVNHATDFGAGEVAVEATGTFETGPPPTVDVDFGPLFMNPTVEQTVTVTVTVPAGRSLAELSSIPLKLWYDSDGCLPSVTEYEAKTTPDTQTYALITWTPTGQFNILPDTDTTWSLNIGAGGCSKPTGTLSTLQTGVFTFKFTPGKVATETADVNAIWQIAATAENTFPTGFGYDSDGANMNWYGELELGKTVNVDWDQVPAGMELSYNKAQQPLGTSIKYISNGDFNKNAKSSATWASAGGNTATLDDTGQPGPNYFCLKADNDGPDPGKHGPAVYLNLTGATFETGALTVEDGQTDDTNSNYLWLELGKPFAEAIYSGTITYIIAPD